MNRRHLLIGGAAAAGLGLWAGLRRPSDEPLPPAASSATFDFWSARFDTLDGGPQLATATLRGKPLLVNFWAPWCGPCVKELPEIDRFHQTSGWAVLGIAVDSAEPVHAFLQNTPTHFPHVLAGLGGASLSRKLGNDQGGLPFSVAFDAAGEVVWRKLGPTTTTELEAVLSHLPTA